MEKNIVWKRLWIVIIIFCIILTQGCASPHIRYTVLIDNLVNADVVATVYLERITGNSYKTKVLFWDEKQFLSGDKKYERTFANVYPVEALDRLQAILGLQVPPEDIYGRLYFYGSDFDYELFIFDESRLNNHQWHLVLLEEENFREITVIKDNANELLDGYQLRGDVIFLFGHFYNNDDIIDDASIIIHEINRKSGTINRMELPVDTFGVDKVVLQLDKICVMDDTLTIVTPQPDSGNMFRHAILSYNLVTEQSKMVFRDYFLYKLFPVEGGYAVLCRIKDQGLAIEYLNSELEHVDLKIIDAASPHGELSAGGRNYFFYLYENVLYGTLSVDGLPNPHYLIAINILNGKTIYLAEFYVPSGYAKQDVRYHLKRDGKYIDIP